jgi:outer membrane receptor protein involved in Fe transport
MGPWFASAADLRIQVTDTSGASVEGARGWIESLNSGRRHPFATGADGAASLTGLGAGRYRVEASKAGFGEWRQVWDVREGESQSRSIRLELAVVSSAIGVTAATPIPGASRTIEEIPGPVQVASAAEIESTGALDLASFLNQRMPGVFINEIQGNPLQPDLNYRGYTASPLLGTPQGLSIYFDGVRQNQSFGDVMSWDLIPRFAIAEAALVSGSNPLFGLNTLGGSISLRSKDGATHPGTTLDLSRGSWGRKIGVFEHGGSTREQRLHWYLGSQLFFEDGWREASPSTARQFFGKLGGQGERTSANLSLSYANNGLIGNGLQEFRFLERDYASVNTKPDQTANRMPFASLNLRRAITPAVTFAGTAYFRYVGARTLNGDINEESLDQSVYQPNAAERAALTAAGFTGFPLAGENAANTPFPKWRCIANVLRRDEPAEKCNGLLNSSSSAQRAYGFSGQIHWAGAGNGLRGQLTAGGAYDGSRTGFTQISELGYLNPDRTITGLAAFGDGVTGGDVDGEPFDTRVNLSSRIHSAGLFAVYALAVGPRLNLNFAGRSNHTRIDNRDLIRPKAGTGSLTGNHSFHRFNPAAGLTYRLPGVQAYLSYSEASRAPTAIELGCADPDAPCKLPNALAGDPPLSQVKTRTYEAGVRGGGAEQSYRWSAGWFRATNRDDILFVSSPQSGFGYFRNFGETLRQGVETEGSWRFRRVTIGGGYTYLRATFESPEEVNGTGNSTNEEAEDGIPGSEGPIEIEPGNWIPLIPGHQAKAHASIQITRALQAQVSVIGASRSFARGNENNLHQPDGRYYVGEGTSPGYSVTQISIRYQVTRRLEFRIQVNNLFNQRFYTGAQLGPLGFTDAGSYIARPFPAIRGTFPVRQSTFLAPGAPRGVFGGIRIRL